MGIDISQFRETYFEESFEGLEVMESGLLELGEGEPDPELINEVFRAAHSIKGGAGTYGLTDVGEVTHVMETLLDEYRNGATKVERKAIDALLTAVDCVRDLFIAAKEDQVEPPEKRQQVIASLERFLALASQAGADASASEAAAGDEPGAADSAASAAVSSGEAVGGGWRVRFAPHAELLKSGNDALRLLRCLADCGTTEPKVDAAAIPLWAEFEPELCYLSWLIDVRPGESATAIEKSVIEEVFEWVDDIADIDVVPLGQVAPTTATGRDTAAAADGEPVAEPAVVDPAVTEPAVTEPAVNGQATPEPGDQAAAAGAAPAASRPAAGRRGSGADSGSIRVNIDKVDTLINMVGELVITQSMLSQVGSGEADADLERLRDGLVQLERNTRELQESVMAIRMVPMSAAFGRIPRVVHDLASKLGKRVELETAGEQTELDKTVMERLHDPLVHIVRNSLDHGLEGPEERAAAGKPEIGRIKLNAYHYGGNIVIEVTDDGRGLDLDRIRAKARERGVLAEDEEIADDKAAELVFAPGFSTAESVTDVSGRGVGMDVVRRNIDALGGAISIQTAVGEGTTIDIRLPLTLAILDGQTICVGGETYILPLNSIIETVQVRDDSIHRIAGGIEVFRLRQQNLPILRLADMFGVPPSETQEENGLLVVVESGSDRVGLLVDELQAQQQIVIKSLETNYQRVAGLSGATILGDGRVALILDVAGLIRVATTTPRIRRAVDAANSGQAGAQPTGEPA